MNILGNAFFLSEDIKSAIDTFEYILAHEPNNVEATNSLAVIYYEEGRYEDAITKFVAALHLDPKNDLVYRNFVSTLKSTDTSVIHPLIELNYKIEKLSEQISIDLPDLELVNVL